MVMCAEHPGLTFTLALVRTEPTYNQPMQQWSFVSDFAVSSDAVTVHLTTALQPFMNNSLSVWLSGA